MRIVKGALVRQLGDLTPDPWISPFPTTSNWSTARYEPIDHRPYSGPRAPGGRQVWVSGCCSRLTNMLLHPEPEKSNLNI